MLKPSRSSVEGQSAIGMLIAGAFFLYTILTSRHPELPPVEEVLKHAESAKDIAEAYNMNGGSIYGLIDLGQSSVVIALMYKVYSKFTDSRTELKKKDMENENDKTD